MNDLISRQAAIDVLAIGEELLKRVLDDVGVVGNEREKYEWGLDLIESYIADMKELSSEQSEVTLELAIDYLRSIGWLQEHDRILSESAQPEIIRCKECTYGEQDDDGWWYCRDFGCQVGNEDGSGFCANAERREE